MVTFLVQQADLAHTHTCPFWTDAFLHPPANASFMLVVIVVRLCVCAGARDGGEGAERGETPCPSKLCCVMGVMSLSFLLLSRLWNTHLRLPVETAILCFSVLALRSSPCIMFHKQLPMCTRSAANENVFLQLVLLTAAVIQIDFVDRGPFAAIVDCLYTTTPFSAPCS